SLERAGLEQLCSGRLQGQPAADDEALAGVGIFHANLGGQRKAAQRVAESNTECRFPCGYCSMRRFSGALSRQHARWVCGAVQFRRQDSIINGRCSRRRYRGEQQLRFAVSSKQSQLLSESRLCVATIKERPAGTPRRGWSFP